MATTLRPGMDVCSTDGHKIGKIHHLFTGAPAHQGAHEHGDVDLDPSEGDHRHLGDVASTYDAALLGTADYGSSQVSGIAPFATPGTGPVEHQNPEGAMTFSPSDTKYMEIRHHAGALGLHTERIYVPFSAVDAITEDTVTLDCSREDAARLYADHPAAD